MFTFLFTACPYCTNFTCQDFGVWGWCSRISLANKINWLQSKIGGNVLTAGRSLMLLLIAAVQEDSTLNRTS